MKSEIKSIAVLILLTGALFANAAEDSGRREHQIQEQEPVEDGPLELSLEEAIARIRAQSPAVLFSRENVKRALERTYQSRSGLLPQVDVSVSQQRQKGRFLPTAPPSTFSFYDAGINASMPLLDAETYADFKISKLGLLIEERNFEAAVQEILEQMITLYFTHLRDLRLIELRTGDVARDTDLYKLAVDQFEAGISTKIDMLRADQRMKSSQRRLLAAEIQSKSSILRLKALLDINHEQEVILDQNLYKGTTGISSPPDLERYASMRASVMERPELKAQLESIKQAEFVRKRAGWQYIPSLDVFGTYGHDSAVIFDGDAEEKWLAGISLSMPVFEGFRISAEKREADAEVRQNKYRLRDLENTLSSEFHFAIQEMESRHQQIEVARVEEELAVEEQELEAERFRQGLTDNSDLINAQQRRSNAEDAFLDTIYQYGLSRIAFARSVGAVERVLD